MEFAVRTMSRVLDGSGWQNVLCLAAGLGILYVGYTGKEFRSHMGREPIPTHVGKLISYITGAVFILFGVFGRHWR